MENITSRIGENSNFILLTYGIDRHRLLQLNRIRVSGFARVFPSLLLLQRVEEQRQAVILVQFGVHRRL